MTDPLTDGMTHAERAEEENTDIGLVAIEPNGRQWKITVPGDTLVGELLKILSNKMNEQLPRFTIQASHLRLQILCSDNVLHKIMDPTKKLSEYGVNDSSKITVHIHRRC